MREVAFTDYALLKMRMRDITKDEVLEGLQAPRSQHFYSSKHGRMNVRHRLSVSGRMLLVSYEERDQETVVVNAMYEKG